MTKQVFNSLLDNSPTNQLEVSQVANWSTRGWLTCRQHLVKNQSASEMTCIVSSGALYSTHSLTCKKSQQDCTEP